jgi:hypothetical protein
VPAKDARPSHRLVTVVDTFPAFQRFWHDARHLALDEQIAAWGSRYLRPWPELFRKQVKNYADERVDWREVAGTRVFPFLSERFAAMETVRRRLRRALPVVTRRARDRLGLDVPVTFVIHVGIGCGAGWATTFAGRPAVLLGIENAAELGWTGSETLRALIGHELGHLLHEQWRRRARKGSLETGEGPYWRLYEEGFATGCEFLLGTIGSHRDQPRGADWLATCRRNRERLAALFLHDVAARRSTTRFFGSWYRVFGQVETGYYLGCELIREWEAKSPIEEIALWSPDRVQLQARRTLLRMAASSVRQRRQIRRSLTPEALRA